MLILEEDINILGYFRLFKDDKLKEQDIERDQSNVMSEKSDTRICARDSLLRYTPQDQLLISKSLASLREIQFSKQEFLTGKPISDIKFSHLDSQNNNLFYSFNDQLNYILATYFGKSEIMERTVDKFLSNLLIVPLTEKLSCQNANK